MTKNYTSARYQGFALLLGAISLVAVACSDDDDDAPDTTAGKGGTGGKVNGGASGKGGNAEAGKDTGGTPNGGKGGTPNGGSGLGGEAQGGEPTGGSGEGPGPIGGEGGGGVGGVGAGGEPMGGAAAGGEGGAPAIVADTLDDGDFGAYKGDWKEEGDAAAGEFKWIADNQPGLNHWAAGAYSISTWQTVTPLPNGTYKFSMEVSHGTLADQYLFAKGCTAGEPEGIVKESTLSAGSAAFTKFELTVTVNSGSCTVGIHSEGPDTPADNSDGWSNMDNATFVVAP